LVIDIRLRFNLTGFLIPPNINFTEAQRENNTLPAYFFKSFFAVRFSQPSLRRYLLSILQISGGNTTRWQRTFRKNIAQTIGRVFALISSYC
jgi:hypothetical protein